MARTLEAIGRRCLDRGMFAALHPHTGTPIETEAEIDLIMEETDPRLVFFAPDTGQIQKGGGDPVAVIRRYAGRVRHMHVKDYGGGPVQHDAEGREIDPTGYVGYVPVGSGVVDFAGITRVLDEASYDGWLMVELDGTPRAPRPPREAAAMSKRTMDALLAGRERRE
jgi:inosose dehydratase